MSKPENRFEEIVEKIRAKNFKLTPQRLAIAKVLSNGGGHPTVEEIHEELRDRFPTMSLATVYRNVLLMKSLGEVMEIGFADGSNRYDGLRPHPHPHVICIECRKILDPDLSGLEDMSEEVAGETGFEIISHRIDFFGICPECRAKR
jgi:Fur family peroxide stress response transcriptional regulator